MQSVLNVTVSCFRSYREATDPKPVNLLTWLRSDKYAEQVGLIRSLQEKGERDALKATLPAITPSGLFSHRKEAGLVAHSGLICLDIDLKGNEGITNYADLKRELSKLVNVAYVGLSVSATGFFVLIPLADPTRHKEHFEALKQDFSGFGIEIDKSCKNISRLRGYSWDADPFFRHDAKPYARFPARVDLPKNKPRPRPANVPAEISDFDLAVKWVERRLYYAEGQRNQFIHNLACACNRLGISCDDATTEIIWRYDLPDEEVVKTVAGAYTRNRAEHGTVRNFSKNNT